MRIVYLANVRIPTEKAFGLAMVRQCEAFSRLGHKVIFVRPQRKNHLTEDIFNYYGVERDFEVVTLSIIQLNRTFDSLSFYLTRFSMMLSSVWYVWKNRSGIDLVYSRDEWLLLLIILLIPKAKTIFEAHTKHDNFVTRYVVKHSDSFVVISFGLKDFYKKFRHGKEVLVEPSGVDTEQFKDLPEQGILRDRLSLPRDSFIFGYMGKYTTMGEEKGVDDVIKAFAETYKSRPDTRLLIVGLEESEVVIVKGVISSLGLPEHSYILRPLDPKTFAEYAKACDVLVMNYPDTEHYRLYMSPSKFFAYLASGRPIIASDLPSIRSVMKDFKVVLVSPGNTQMLAGEMMQQSDKDYTYITNVNNVEYYSWLDRGRRILSR